MPRPERSRSGAQRLIGPRRLKEETPRWLQQQLFEFELSMRSLCLLRPQRIERNGCSTGFLCMPGCIVGYFFTTLIFVSHALSKQSAKKHLTSHGARLCIVISKEYLLFIRYTISMTEVPTLVTLLSRCRPTNSRC